MYSTLTVTSQVNIYSGPKYGTNYDLSGACHKCGTGAKAIGPRYLKIKKIPKHAIFQTLDRDVFVNEELKCMLEDELNGLSSFLWPVLNPATQDPLPLWEIRAEIILPKFSDGTIGFELEMACKECNRDGYFGIPNVPFKPAYNKTVLSSLTASVLATWEHFGNSRLRTPFKDSVFAMPILLISGELREIFERNKIPGVLFESILMKK